MKEWAELLQAIAALLWPIITLCAVLAFKKEIRSLLQRVRRGKLLGQEIELEERLTELNIAANSAASEIHEMQVRLLQPEASATGNTEGPVQAPEESDITLRIFEEAARFPKAALLTLAAAMEEEIRKILLSRGVKDIGRFTTLGQSVDILRKQAMLPSQVIATLNSFVQLRNRLVHHGEGTNTDAILRALDSGATLLNAIRAIPHEIHTVLYPIVKIYSDPECSKQLRGVHGVLIESKTTDSAVTIQRIFPTTLAHFKTGGRVAWEWNEANRYERAWYHFPETNEIMLGWDSSIEFVGRNLD